MDDAELEANYGAELCLYLSHDFVRNNLRLDVRKEKFFEKVLNSIVACDDLQTEFMLPSFWIEIISLLDSKYTINRRGIKSSTTWISIANKFFNKIYPNVSRYEIDECHVLKLQSAINYILTQNKFDSPIDLLASLRQTYIRSKQSDQFRTNPNSIQIQTETQIQTTSEIQSNEQGPTELPKQSDQFCINPETQIQTTSEIQSNEQGSTELSFHVTENSSNDILMNSAISKDMNNNFDEEVQSSKIDGKLENDENLYEIENNSLNNSADSQRILEDTDTDDEVSENSIQNENSTNLEPPIDKNVSLDILDKLDLNNIYDSSNEDFIEPFEHPRKKAKLDSVTDSLEVGKSKYFKKKHFTNHQPCDNEKELHNQAVNELNLLLKRPERPNSFKGKKVQLRTANKSVHLNLSNYSDMDDFDNASICSDDNESVISNLSFTSRTDYNRVTNNKAKHAYSMDEDNKILVFIINKGRYAEIKGNQLWKDIQEKKVVVGRSWQSMKNRFLKTILPNIQLYAEMYKIDKKAIEHLQDNVCNSASNDKSVPKNNASSALGNSYSKEEDEEILKFVSEKTDLLMGRSIWLEVEKYFYRRLNRKRTWQSLKERFIKRIVPRIYQYDSITSYENALSIINKFNLSLDVKNIIKLNLKKRFN